MASDFERFWEAYPRHDAKKSAERALKAVLKHHAIEEVLKAVEVSKIIWEGRKVDYWPYPATYLRATDFSDKAAQPSLIVKEDPRKPDPRIVEILRREDKPPDWAPMTVEEVKRLPVISPEKGEQ